MLNLIRKIIGSITKPDQLYTKTFDFVMRGENPTRLYILGPVEIYKSDGSYYNWTYQRVKQNYFGAWITKPEFLVSYSELKKYGH